MQQFLKNICTLTRFFYFHKRTVKDSTILTGIPCNSGKYRYSICKFTLFYIKVRKRQNISPNIILVLPWVYIRPSTFQKLLNQINAFQKLWLISFMELFVNNNSVLIHKQNLQFLVMEISRFKKYLSPALIEEINPQNKQNTYKLGNNTDLTWPLMTTSERFLVEWVPKFVKFCRLR